MPDPVISAGFYIPRTKNGIVKLENTDEFFPLDMGDDKFVWVKVSDIDKGKSNAQQVIHELNLIFSIAHEAVMNAEKLFRIFDNRMAALNARYHFNSSTPVVSWRVVLFHMLFLRKNGNEIDMRNYMRLNDFVEARAYSENVYRSYISLVNLFTTFSPMNLYKEKREQIIIAIQRQIAFAEKVIIPMAELLRFLLTEGLMWALGLEIARVIYGVLRGIMFVYEFVRGLSFLNRFQWLFRLIEALANYIVTLAKAFLVYLNVKDTLENVKKFVNMLNEIVDGIMQVLVFEDYTLENEILILDGISEFNSEDDEFLMETLQEFPEE